MKIDEIAELIEPSNFSPFAIVTKGGLRMDIPHPEFMAIPPSHLGTRPSYVIAFTKSKTAMPKLIDLDAIDHIDYENPAFNPHKSKLK